MVRTRDRRRTHARLVGSARSLRTISGRDLRFDAVEAGGSLRESVRMGIDRVRASWRAIVETSIAAGLAWLLADQFIGHQGAFFAPIAAVVVLGLNPGRRTRRAVDMTIGVTAGVLVGDAFIALTGPGTLQVTAVVLVAMAVAVFFWSNALLVSQAASSAVLIATLVPPTQGIYVTRVLDALLGGAVAIGVLLAIPGNPAGEIAGALRPTLRELGAILSTLARAIADGDDAAALRSLERARALDVSLMQVRQVVDRARESAQLGVSQRRGRGRVEHLATISEPLDAVVLDVRGLARNASRAIELSAPLDSDLALAVAELADAVNQLERVTVDDRSPDDGTRAARQASALATAIANRGRPMPVASLVGQIRICATDLLRALGVDEAEATRMVRAAD